MVAFKGVGGFWIQGQVAAKRYGLFAPLISSLVLRLRSTVLVRI